MHDYDCALVLEPRNVHVLHNRWAAFDDHSVRPWTGRGLSAQHVCLVCMQQCTMRLVCCTLTPIDPACRGILHTKLNDLQSALADFSSVLELEPANVSALYNRGCIHDQLEQYEAALDDYSKALELDTGSLQASTQ